MSVANMQYGNDEYEFNQETFIPAGTTILPEPGNYEIRVKSLSRVKDENEQDKLETNASGDPTFPVLRINRFEIVSPEGDAGEFQLFQEVRTKPFADKSRKGQMVSNALDVLAAIDESALNGLTNFMEIGQECESQLKGGRTARVYIGYTGYDKAFIDQQKQAGNLTPDTSKEVTNKLYNQARLNTKAFRGLDGKARQTATGPSGQTVQAKLKITSWVPSSQDVKLGATQVVSK